MQKYTITKIQKVNSNKAEVKYTRGNNVPYKSKRTVYKNVDGGKVTHHVLFKGIKLEVEFNDLDIATRIEAKEIYDEKVKKYDGDRVEKINLEIKNEFAPTQQELERIKPEQQPQTGEVKHKEFDTIKTFVEMNIPVYLYGPAGSGKNHTLQQIADELGLEFYFTNSVQQEYKLTGFIDAGGKFHETEFYKAFTKGGLFFLDEMDASIPEVLVLLNAALANGYFEFPNGKVHAHKEFRVVAAGNTVGAGADEQYTGRLQLDQATLDRFAMIEFDYDYNIELHIAKGNKELVMFIRSLRTQAKEQGINATFSYRSITMVAKLEGKLPLDKIIETSVVKGMDMDTIRTFKTTPNNKYSKALWMVTQRAS